MGRHDADAPPVGPRRGPVRRARRARHRPARLRARCLVGAAFASRSRCSSSCSCWSAPRARAVNSSSGRAVMNWFARERARARAGRPADRDPARRARRRADAASALADAGGSKAAFLFLAALVALGALVGALVLRGRERRGRHRAGVGPADDGRPEALAAVDRQRPLPLRADRGHRVRRPLPVDEHGFSEQSAALAFACGQVLAMAFRIGAGRWSDVMGAGRPAAAGRGRRRGRDARHRRARGRARLAARAGARPRLRAVDGMERALVHRRRRARRAAAERSGDRRPADRALARRRRRAPGVRGLGLAGRRGPRLSACAAFVPLAGWWLLGALSERRHTAAS